MISYPFTCWHSEAPVIKYRKCLLTIFQACGYHKCASPCDFHFTLLVDSDVTPFPHDIVTFPRQKNTFLVVDEPMQVFASTFASKFFAPWDCNCVSLEVTNNYVGNRLPSGSLPLYVYSPVYS